MLKAVSDREKIARYQAFWQRAETDRPLIGGTIGTFPSARSVRGHGLLTPDDLDLEENLRELEEEWEQWRDASGDALWSAIPLWAFPWHMAMAGCPVQRDGDNFWVLPALEDWSQIESVRFDPGNPWFQLLLRLTQALELQAAGRYPVGVGPLMLGPVDMLMQLRGQERLALDFYDAPERVAALGERCVKLCVQASDALFAAVPPYLGGYAGTSRYFWAPGRLVESAEDITFMMSPEAHRRFVLPMHQGLARAFPYTVVHLHSTQLRTVPDLLQIEEIAAIEITPDFGEDMRPYIAVMGQILERKPLIVHGVMDAATIQEMVRSLPARGLALFCRCSSPEEARRLLGSLL